MADLLTARSVAYYEAHKEEIATLDAAYRKVYKEKYAAYYAKHVNDFIHRAQLRKARLENLPFSLTPEEWLEILKAHDYTCHYCGQPKKLEREHVVPIERGGGYTKENIVPACTPCNRGKNHRYDWPPRVPKRECNAPLCRA